MSRGTGWERPAALGESVTDAAKILSAAKGLGNNMDESVKSLVQEMSSAMSKDLENATRTSTSVDVSKLFDELVETMKEHALQLRQRQRGRAPGAQELPGCRNIL